MLDEKWKSYVQIEYSTPGKMHGLIKTHKSNNPEWTIRVVVTLLLSLYPYLWKRNYMI